jgi:hypothetical protein
MTLAVGLVAALLGLAGCNLDLSSGAEARDQWQRQYKLPPGGTLELRNTNGVVRFEVTDEEGIDVRAVRIVRANSDQAAKEALAAFEIRETVGGDRVAIDSTNSGAGLTFSLQRRVEYVIRVPRWTNLKVETTNGDIEVGGGRVTGTFQAGTTNGGIRALGLENTAAASTTNGQIHLEIAKITDNGVSCETTNGAIELTVPPDINARLSARVTNGSINTEGLTLGVSEKSRRRLDGAIGRGGPTITLETTNGSIDVRAGAGTREN